MLKLTLLLGLLISFSAFACYRVEGKLGVDGETFDFGQKAEVGKEYTLPAGSFIFSFTLHPIPKKKNEFALKYKIEERVSNRLVPVSSGVEDLSVGKGHEIYAKGLEKQPNAIINIKVIDI